jgi:hypothetical protein
MSDLVETADRLSRRRARMLPILALFLLIQQATFVTNPRSTDLVHGRLVDQVHFGGWAVLTLVLLAGLATGGFWFRSSELRALLNDEQTAAHRRDSMAFGFIVSALTGTVLYVVASIEPLEPHLAINLIIAFGLAAALLRFAVLERRAHKLG